VDSDEVYSISTDDDFEVFHPETENSGLVPVQFVCSVAQVRTLADGGIRVVFDLPEDAIAQAAVLMKYKMVGVALSVIVEED